MTDKDIKFLQILAEEIDSKGYKAQAKRLAMIIDQESNSGVEKLVIKKNADNGKTFLIYSEAENATIALSQEDILNEIDGDMEMMDNGEERSWTVTRKDMTELEINNYPNCDDIPTAQECLEFIRTHRGKNLKVIKTEKDWQFIDIIKGLNLSIRYYGRKGYQILASYNKKEIANKWIKEKSSRR